MRLSDAEWTVMQSLWQDSPASARAVLERLSGEPNWAYSTVKTLLDRLEQKGAVSVRKVRNTRYYAACVTRRQARRVALRSLVDRAFDGAFGSLVQHLVAEERLTNRDRKEIRQLLDTLESRP